MGEMGAKHCISFYNDLIYEYFMMPYDCVRGACTVCRIARESVGNTSARTSARSGGQLGVSAALLVTVLPSQPGESSGQRPLPRETSAKSVQECTWQGVGFPTSHSDTTESRQ